MPILPTVDAPGPSPLSVASAEVEVSAVCVDFIGRSNEEPGGLREATTEYGCIKPCQD
jgi:hypothetical protein